MNGLDVVCPRNHTLHSQCVSDMVVRGCCGDGSDLGYLPHNAWEILAFTRFDDANFYSIRSVMCYYVVFYVVMSKSSS
jgi:hypothetical protein